MWKKGGVSLYGRSASSTPSAPRRAQRSPGSARSRGSRGRPGIGGGPRPAQRKGPWPAPAQDAVEADAKTLAADWEGWGRRKLAALKGFGIGSVEAGPVPDPTMHRVPARNGLALRANYTAEIRKAAGARKQAFVDPPTRRNRLWQADFSEFETNGAGTWNLGGVVDC
ncbi:MAG: hypothetical protein OXF75_09460 [Acidimicrobiaceae bacterium]|nr:hypothetical protein [Acidimicrobiaceae bacterium]